MIGPQEEGLHVKDVGPLRPPEAGSFLWIGNLAKFPTLKSRSTKAELTLGPTPERGDMRRRSDAVMSGSFSFLAQRLAPTCPSQALPQNLQDPWVLQLPSAQLWPGWPPAGLVQLPTCVLPCSQPRPCPPGQELHCEGVDALLELPPILE